MKKGKYDHVQVQQPLGLLKSGVWFFVWLPCVGSSDVRSSTVQVDHFAFLCLTMYLLGLGRGQNVSRSC